MTDERRRWLITIIAVVSIVYGVMVLGKPYQTLETVPIWLALVVLFLVVWQGSILHRSAMGLVVLSVAVTLVVARDAAIELLVYGVLAYTLFSGIHALLGLRRCEWFRAMLGMALVLLAILGAYWVDVASIAIGLLIGPVLIVASVMMLNRVWRSHDASTTPRAPGAQVTRAGRIGAVMLLIVMLLGTYGTYRAILAEPELDAFAEYNDPIGDEPGVLLRAMPFSRAMPDNSIATRILYTTTGRDGSVVLATGLVIVPTNAPDAPLPVILWAHGTTGVEVTCAPTLVKDPLEAGAMLFPELPLEQGWAIVAPDYLGLGASAPHPYLVGQPAAHSSLDAVRAARQLESISLGDDTVVWGHSQGGGTALWIGIEQEAYAPDVPLLGIAAMAPASNLPEFIDTLLAGPAGPIFGGYMLRGYADWYDDVHANEYIRPGARFSQEKLVQRCLSAPSFLANIASALVFEPFTLADVHSGPLYERMQENVSVAPMSAPVFLAQGGADTLITPGAQSSFVAALCDIGEVVEYRTYAGRDHMGIVADDSPMLTDLMIWTQARFDGESGAATCTITEPDH